MTTDNGSENGNENGNGSVAPATNRDSTGKFLPGHRLGGRRRAIDLRALAEQYAAREGLDLPEALWEVVKTLLRLAKGGDVVAARLLLERLTDSDPLAVHVVTDGLSDTERATRLAAILAAAEARVRGVHAAS